MDQFKLTVDTLKSVHKERDSVEMEIYAELFRELEEVDLRVSRTRSARGRGRGRACTTRPSTHVRRGSGSSSAAATREEEDLGGDLREPEYDEHGNILSEGDFGLISSAGDSSEETSSIHSDSDTSPSLDEP